MRNFSKIRYFWISTHTFSQCNRQFYFLRQLRRLHQLFHVNWIPVVFDVQFRQHLFRNWGDYSERFRWKRQRQVIWQFGDIVILMLAAGQTHNSYSRTWVLLRRISENIKLRKFLLNNSCISSISRSSILRCPREGSKASARWESCQSQLFLQ